MNGRVELFTIASKKENHLKINDLDREKENERIMELEEEIFFVHIDCFFICSERDIFRSLANRSKRVSRRIYQSKQS